VGIIFGNAGVAGPSVAQPGVVYGVHVVDTPRTQSLWWVPINPIRNLVTGGLRRDAFCLSPLIERFSA
jgi:hypothetical protein